MAQPLVALGVNTPNIDTMQQYTAGRTAAINENGAQQQQEAAALNHIAQLGFGIMGGKLDGPIDPKGLDFMITQLGDNPLAAKLKADPELLRILTKGSAEVAAQAQNNQAFEMAKQKFDLELRQYTNPLPVKMSPGDFFSDPRSGKQIGGDTSGAGGFYGSSTDQQALQILSKGDPSTYEYAQAFNVLSQPVTSLQPDGKGGMVQVTTPRTLPQGTRPPTYAGQVAPASPAAPASATGAPVAANVGPADSPAPIGALGNSAAPNGTTVTPLPGLQTPQTEAQVRSGVLSSTLNAVAPELLKNFDVFADPTNQALTALSGIPVIGGAANLMQSEAAQKANSSMASALQTIVFQLSGANTGTNEMLNTAKSMTPAFGDKPGEVAFKKSLLISYIKSIAEASKDQDKKTQAQAILDAWGPEAAAPQKTSAVAPAATDTSGDLPEGTIIADKNGNQMIMQEGTWHKLNEHTP